MDSFLKRVSDLQSELKAPKNQYNKFGKYNYRSCEDILEAAKPLCKKYSMVLNLSDKIINLNNRYYIESTATLYDIESDAKLASTASAREAEIKKGMDDSQITGTASSYARKYALNGLFNIDDTKDADTNEHNNLNKNNNQSANSNQDKVICPKCGNEVKPVKMRKENEDVIVVPQEVVKKCGMCYDCYKKSNEKQQ